MVFGTDEFSFLLFHLWNEAWTIQPKVFTQKRTFQEYHVVTITESISAGRVADEWVLQLGTLATPSFPD
jgi:hypothetical protein